MTTQGKAHTIVVHYSATYPDQRVDVSVIDQWHRQRGFSGCGYHWVVLRDGTVQPGRPESVVGAHVRGRNTGTIGICWTGGLDRATGPNKGVWNPTPEQERALVKLIREVLARHPGARVVGHCDLVATECPGLPKGGVAAWWANHQWAAAHGAQIEGPRQGEPASPNDPERVGLMAWLVELFRRIGK
jgi:N-acetylmuramoyl-L-alanine amidase